MKGERREPLAGGFKSLRGLYKDRRDACPTNIMEKIGHYKILANIGSGGLGKVFKAEDPQGNIVAIKLLSPEFTRDKMVVESFLRESRLLENLHHPNIIRSMGDGKVRGKYYIVMEYVEGESIKDLQTKKKMLIEQEVIKVLLQVVDALAYLHSHSIIHRDIKPQNILIKDGHVNVADFGIAILKTTDKKISESRSGTAIYMSPEQIKGQDIDLRSDIYSLGVTAYEMLTGTIPFDGPDPNTIMTKHLNFLATPPHVVSSSISPKMSEIVMKMLEKEPSKRYQDARELKEELKRLERTPSISGKEDRKYRRLEEHIRICYRSLADSGISECVFTKDIGDAGIKFVTKIPIPERVILEVDISLPDYKDAIKVLGKVKWVKKDESTDGYEIGCEFLEMSEKDKNRLMEHIRVKSN